MCIIGNYTQAIGLLRGFGSGEGGMGVGSDKPGEMACTAAQTARSTCCATEQAVVVMRLDDSGLMVSSAPPS